MGRAQASSPARLGLVCERPPFAVTPTAWAPSSRPSMRRPAMGSQLSVPLMLALLLQLTPLAAAGGGGGGEEWDRESYEETYVEVLVLIALVCLALLFETVWHYAVHHVDDSYGYGKLTDQVALGNAPEHESRYKQTHHVQLYKELTNRMGGEFMTLGFLAFNVFIFNNAGGFKLLATHFPSGNFSLPRDDQDWLHLVELVHVQLFVGMIFYFFLISRIVAGAVSQIREWEQLRLRRVTASQHEAHHVTFGGRDIAHHKLQAADHDLAKYLTWRAFFLERLLRWSDSRPLLYRELLRSLDIDPRQSHGQDQHDRFYRQTESRFAFSAYLALNVEEGIRDSIVVHRTTWLAVLGVLVIFELLCRFAHVDITAATPVFIVIVLVILFLMGWVVRKRVARIDRFAGEQGRWYKTNSASIAEDSRQADDTSGPVATARSSTMRTHASQHTTSVSIANTVDIKDNHNNNFHQQHSTEMFTMRLLQIVIFMISYVFARYALDIHGWETKPQIVLLYCSLFLLLFGLLSHILPRQVHVGFRRRTVSSTR
mmetsp:Transcript_58027/g.149356  ORF Transcript_58027/g.149356 Transcript_58027/m.149356 type:complete len:542 (+) Transcript_58027:1-1626(+)